MMISGVLTEGGIWGIHLTAKTKTSAPPVNSPPPPPTTKDYYY